MKRLFSYTLCSKRGCMGLAFSGLRLKWGGIKGWQIGSHGRILAGAWGINKEAPAFRARAFHKGK
jgi:hypothetical protein